ncbi:hypothetical protein HMPREF0620_0067 [Parascardovia denticolens DSM 10105 = JCM 12538]|uniref:Uncharacterized protein n=1 Tax=Parascardovia denticolens DSM 10105 = JCM 12538 TaxID=864564 RepID=E6JYQ1_PARDN|nr:hypothetical protein HMPREF0620_0067 [Parascardovia denticolens DSM 10105 = JCM 12538]
MYQGVWSLCECTLWEEGCLLEKNAMPDAPIYRWEPFYMQVSIRPGQALFFQHNQ